jgi:hypothetical protein
MCFSPEASFIASGFLATTSVAIARVPKPKAAVPLSLFPAVFAAHQAIEGTLWLMNDGVLPATYQAAAVTAYSAIAFVLWPVAVPLSALLLEGERNRRGAMLGCQAVGLGVGLALLLALLREPVQVSAYSCHLAYYINAPGRLTLPYLVAVCMPFLLSSQRGLALFGAGLAATCGAAGLAFSAVTFPSVWCFFAAVLSAGLYLYFRAAAHTPARAPAPWRGPGTATRQGSLG